jgi:GNAT superfamily N-acetyltransferase
MGVAQAARGTGVADALLQWAVETVARVGDVDMSLAVDADNTPARRLYERWDFVETGARDAWIAISPVARGVTPQKTRTEAYPQ